jgi:CubicO group peptidase (beta-lactamase class C family)
VTSNTEEPSCPIPEAVARQDLPFAVGMVADSAGVVWAGASGQSSGGHEAGPDTLFRLFSMTKGIGSLAALILVDRGQLSLETPVADVLPEFAKLQVVESVGPEGPVLRPARRPATLRHLLTHTSGLAYEAFHETMHVFQQSTGLQDHLTTGAISSLQTPLMFDPGEGWAYGIGYDWAGYMVQQVDGRPIHQICQEEILDPLGLKNTAFESDAVPAPLADLHLRGEDGTFSTMEFAAPSNPEIYGMGVALYGTAPDYMRFLRLILNGGELDGYRPIGPETLRLMTTNQIGSMTVPVVTSHRPDLSCDVDHLFAETPMTHTAAFVRSERDVPGMRRAGSLWWAGFFNTHFWIDPATDVAALLMTQSLPFCDARYMRVFTDFERAVYRDLV